MGNPKEECFESATEALRRRAERQGKEPPELDHKQPWEQAYGDGSWSAVNKTWHHAMNSVVKTYNQIAQKLGIDPARPTQVRFPDVTVTTPSGKQVVVDCKFDRPSGGRDSWGSNPGMNGKTQLEDYNDINKQNTGKGDQGLSLDADVCKCGPEGSPESQPVYDDSVVTDPASPYYSPLGVPVPPTPLSPGVGAPVPQAPQVPQLPPRIPIPRFVFP